MPSKKKKYNARFPAGRIKKIMQSDEEIGKVAQAVPVIISRTLELFVESLLAKTLKITNSRNAKTLSPSHLKQCIMAEQRFDFLRELVKNTPDISLAEEAANYNEEDVQSSPEQESFSDAGDLNQKPTSSGQCVTRSISVAAAKDHAPTELASNGSEPQENGSEPKLRRMRRLQQHEQLPSQQQHQQRSRELDIIERLQQRVGLTIKTNTVLPSSSSVIKHTNALPGGKLTRAESLPEESEHASCSSAKRFKKSAPATTTPTATIPPPIVHFDFCSKPVVKIDYSNIPMTALSGDTVANATPTSAKVRRSCISTAPQSAPPQIANISCKETAFDFSQPPISINIDLSNIDINEGSNQACSNQVKPKRDACFELDEDYDNI